MQIIINKPYVISWIFIPLFLLLGLLSKKDTAIDIQLHDTYFVVESFQLMMLVLTILALTGLGYWTIQQLDGKPNKILTGVHLTLTIGFFLLIMVPALTTNSQSFQNQDYNSWRRDTSLFLIGFFSFLLSQIIYLINLVIGILTR